MQIETPPDNSKIKPGLQQFVSLCAGANLSIASSNERGVILLALYNGRNQDQALRLQSPVSKSWLRQAKLDLEDAISESGLTKQDFLNLRERFRKLEIGNPSNTQHELRLIYTEAMGHFISVLTQLERRGYKLLGTEDSNERHAEF